MLPKLASPRLQSSISALLLATLICCSAATAQESGDALKWSSIDGREIEAAFVRTTEKSVVLRPTGSSQDVEVPFNKLSMASHLQALKLANPEAYNKPLVKAEVKPDMAEPAFTIDPETLLKNPIPPDPTLDQFLSTIKTELSNHNSMVMWHALPPKMQADIQSVLAKGAAKLGDATITQIRTLLTNVNTIVQDKHQFIVGHPLVSSNPQVTTALDDLWPVIAGYVNALTDQSLWQSENFKEENSVRWMADFTAKVGPYASQLAEAAKEYAPPEMQMATGNIDQEFNYNILSQSKDRAEVEFTLGDNPPYTLKLQKVGNTWVPPKEMNDIRKQLDAALKAVEGNDRSALQPVQFALVGINGAVGALAAANTQEEFNQAIANMQALAQTMVPAGMGAGGPPPPGGRPQGGR